MPLIKSIPECKALYAGSTLIWAAVRRITGTNKWALTGRTLKLEMSGRPPADLAKNGNINSDGWRIVSANGRAVSLPPFGSITYRDYGTSWVLDFVFSRNPTYNAIPAGATVVVEYPPKG